MAGKKTIRVLIVDDSAISRTVLSEILSSDPDIEVVGTAHDPYIARTKIKQLNPDVLTLDVEMPRMNGIVFLKNLMRLRPMPVVMVSSLTQKDADVALEALGLGAVDYVGKPDINSKISLADYYRELISKIKMAAAPVRHGAVSSTNSLHTDTPELGIKLAKNPLRKNGHQAIVVIGASTGGTEAIREIMSNLKSGSYSVIVVQHIPGTFSKAFTQRINNTSILDVVEAENDQEVLPGHAYIAPGDRHLTLIRNRNGNTYHCQLHDGEAVNRHKPSVDVLFKSVSISAGSNAIGILLTGMGCDGASGLKELHDTGAITIAQDEESSIVWGMPGEAVKLKAADFILPLNKIAGKVTTLMNEASN